MMKRIWEETIQREIKRRHMEFNDDKDMNRGLVIQSFNDLTGIFLSMSMMLYRKYTIPCRKS